MAEREAQPRVPGAPAGDLVFMGPPGVGKGTQAKNFTRAAGWRQLSTGELFRDHIKRGTPVGLLARSFIDKGEYVPDDVTVRMVKEFIDGLDRDERVMFDGFPRTVAQARELDRLLADRNRRIWRVLLLTAPQEELERRILARSRAEGRTDDTPEVIHRRFDVYNAQTAPVIGYYRARGLVKEVDGVGTVEEVTRRLKQKAAER